MELFDEIRAFIIENYFKPAKARGEKSLIIVSGEVHTKMNLCSRMPAVCNALRSEKPWNISYVELVKETRKSSVKKDSSTNQFTFSIK